MSIRPLPFLTDDLEQAEQKCENAQKELETTLSELGDI